MRTKKMITLGLAAFLAFSLSGCKESDVIEQLVYSLEAEEMTDAVAMGNTHGEGPVPLEETDQSPEGKEGEAEAKDDPGTEAEKEETTDAVESRTETADAAGGTGQENGSDSPGGVSGESPVEDRTGFGADGTLDNSGSDSKGEEQEGQEEPEGQEEQEEPEEKEEQEGQEEQEEPDIAEDGPVDSPDSEQGNGSGSEKTPLSEDPNARQVYDKDGNVIDVPENVNRVAAAGEAALIVQMLGGDSILCASSESFVYDALAQKVFADEGIADVETLWSGDGSIPMSDETFQRLLELEPDCCVAMSGVTNFSDAQIGKLKEADIPYLLIPNLKDAAENTDLAVEIVGKAIGDRSKAGGINAENLAAEYLAYRKALENEVTGRHGICDKSVLNAQNDLIVHTYGQYTAYIDGWDDSLGATEWTADGELYTEQTGLAITTNYGYFVPSSPWCGECELPVRDYYLGHAGVYNMASQRRGTHASAEDSGLSSWIADRYILWPLEHLNTLQGITQTTTGFEPYTYYTTLSGVTRAHMANIDYLALGGLGREWYPAVITATQEIKAKMEASRDSGKGLYRSQRSYDSGFSSDAPGNIDTAAIAAICSDDYQVYANPQGVGDWVMGSVESILECVWASGKFYEDSYSDAEIQEKVKDFYSRFYRYDLSDAEAADILDGE